MNPDTDRWERLAIELDAAMFRRPARPARRPVRTLGPAAAVAEAIVRPVPTLAKRERVAIVVVEVPRDRARPEEAHLRALFQTHMQLAPSCEAVAASCHWNVYYIREDVHWAALDPLQRELNPHDAECGRDHELLLRNLTPDIVFTSSRRCLKFWSKTSEVQQIPW